MDGKDCGWCRGLNMSASAGTLPSPKNVLARVWKTPTAMWAMRQASVVTGGGSGSPPGPEPSDMKRPSASGRTDQQPATGSQ